MPKCNKKWWGSFLLLSLGLNSLPGSCDQDISMFLRQNDEEGQKNGGDEHIKHRVLRWCKYSSFVIPDLCMGMQKMCIQICKKLANYSKEKSVSQVQLLAACYCVIKTCLKCFQLRPCTAAHLTKRACFGFSYVLKVSYFQNELMKSSFLPRYEQIIARISVLNSEGRNPDNFLIVFWEKQWHH